MINLGSILKTRVINLPTKFCIIKVMLFCVVMYGCEWGSEWKVLSHVRLFVTPWMWELDHKEGFAPKNQCFTTVVLENTLESPLNWKEIKPVKPKGNQPWILIGRTDAEAEAPILWPPDAKNWLIGKDPDAGKIESRGEGDDRGQDGWIVSPIQWTWV